MPSLRILAIAAAAFMGGAAPAALACDAGAYTYAGVAGDTTVAGVRATVTSTGDGFDVLAGHVAGWVGVGGPGQGPGGSDEWLQVGLSAFPQWSGNDLYYEIALPGEPPTYHRVSASLDYGSRVRVAVLEMRGRANWWRVWVDGSPVSTPIHLVSSHGRWLPIVTAESWDGNTSACNAFLYRFDGISVARRPGGLWAPLWATRPIDDANTTVVQQARGRLDAAGGVLGLRALASPADVAALSQN